MSLKVAALALLLSGLSPTFAAQEDPADERSLAAARLLTPEKIEKLIPEHASTGEVRDYLNKLLKACWYDRWKKARYRSRNPAKPIQDRPVKIRQTKSHDSVFRILKRNQERPSDRWDSHPPLAERPMCADQSCATDAVSAARSHSNEHGQSPWHTKIHNVLDPHRWPGQRLRVLRLSAFSGQSRDHH